MTETERTRREIAEAREAATGALDRARFIRERSAKIGEGWLKSRTDNNFRLMLRNLGREVPGAS